METRTEGNPEDLYPTPPFKKQDQKPPGETKLMDPKPDHGEQSYEGNGLLTGKVAVITGGDSGIGKATAIAMAREGADIVIAYKDDVEAKMLKTVNIGLKRQEKEPYFLKETSAMKKPA